MLHLAQVQGKDTGGKTTLQLLAQQRAEYVWVLLSEPDYILSPEADDYHLGTLVLVELSSTRQVKSIQDVKEWMLEIIDQYLGAGFTPGLLQEEVQRAEQWRQSLTLQSQELGRRTLEVEAHRDRIQQLEEDLGRRSQEIEARREQVQQLEQELNQQAQEIQARAEVHPNPVQNLEELDRRSQEVEARWQELQQLELDIKAREEAHCDRVQKLEEALDRRALDIKALEEELQRREQELEQKLELIAVKLKDKH